MLIEAYWILVEASSILIKLIRWLLMHIQGFHDRLPKLGALFFLLESLDAPVAQALEEAECRELHFAVPWILTWFDGILRKHFPQGTYMNFI